MEIELDPEDFNAKGLRKLLKGMKPSHQKSDEENEQESDKKAKENDDLVDLHREKKGDSKPPKVTKDDLPEGLSDEDSDEEDKEESDG
jgi:hypothetical protein